MKKELCLGVCLCLLISSVSGQSLFKDLKNAANSAKNAADSVKKISSKKKVAVEEESKEEVPAEKRLDKEDALFVYLNLSGAELDDDFYIDYARYFERDTYDKYKDDEFEWEEQFANIKNRCNQRIENADVDSVYIASTELKFGDYDFTNGGYHITLAEGTFFPLGQYIGNFRSNTYFRKQVAIKLQDMEKYSFLPMEKDKAKAFLQGRKSDDGVDRRVTVVYRYEIDSFNSKEYKEWENLAVSHNYMPILGIIKSVEVYDTKGGKFEKLGDLIIKE